MLKLDSDKAYELTELLENYLSLIENGHKHEKFAKELLDEIYEIRNT